jgi:hypothetical protein
MDAVYLEDIPRTIEFLLSIDQFIFDIDGGALGQREAYTRPAHLMLPRERFGYLRLTGSRHHDPAIELILQRVSDALPQAHRPSILANARVST